MDSHDVLRLHLMHTDHASILQSINEAAHHLYFSKIKAHGLYPHFDVKETEDFYELFGELPGCRMEDISIHNMHGYGVEIDGEIPTFNTDLGDRGKGANGAVSNGPEKDPQASTATVPLVSSDGASLHKFESTISEHARHLQNGPQSRPTEESSSLYPRLLFHERITGKFSRHIRFPDPVDTTNVKAVLKDGILRIRVPKDLVKISKLEKERKKVEVLWDQGALWGF